MNDYSTDTPIEASHETTPNENLIVLPSLEKVNSDQNQIISSDSTSNLDLSGIKAGYTDEFSRQRKNLYNFDEMPVTDMPTITDQADRDPWLENLSPQLRQLYLKKMRQELGLLDEQDS